MKQFIELDRLNDPINRTRRKIKTSPFFYCSCSCPEQLLSLSVERADDQHSSSVSTSCLIGVSSRQGTRACGLRWVGMVSASDDSAAISHWKDPRCLLVRDTGIFCKACNKKVRVAPAINRR